MAEAKLSEAVALSPFDGLDAVKAALLDKAETEKLRRQEKMLSAALAETQGALKGARERREEHARDAQRPGEDVTSEEAAARRAEFRDLVEKQQSRFALAHRRASGGSGELGRVALRDGRRERSPACFGR